MTDPTPDPAPDPSRKPAFEERVNQFGREAEAAGERIGQQAEAAGKRFSNDPHVQGAADTAARVWGLIVLGVGLWFLADVTFGLDMPTIPWRDIWPLGIIIIGLAILLRGMRRRSA